MTEMTVEELMRENKLLREKLRHLVRIYLVDDQDWSPEKRADKIVERILSEDF